METAVSWFNGEDAARLHPLLRIGTFVYEFLSIHPFQDGNGRLSRLLTTLLYGDGERFMKLGNDHQSGNNTNLKCVAP